MSKMRLFYHLNRQHIWKYVMLFIVFVFAGIVISSTLFVQKNNRDFYEAQIQKMQQENQIQGDTAANLQEFKLIFNRVEDVLGIFSFASILIVIWGGANLLFFKDLSMQKSYAMCRIYGMKQFDLIYKAIGDFFIFGFAAGVVGSTGGFLLFRYLAVHVCKTETVFTMISLDAVITVAQVTVILSIIAFGGSLASGIFVYQKNIMSILFERKEKIQMNGVWCVVGVGAMLLTLIMTILFKGDKKYIGMVMITFIITAALLYGIFNFFFSKQTKKYRNRKPLHTIKGLSYRFLCTRCKKDAVLAATVSVGAILICFIMNLEFNFSGIIEDSYRDNMGYSIGVSMKDWDERENVENILDQNGYQYTILYTKLMEYSELKDSLGAEGKFWAAVVGKQTDNNAHFKVDEGAFCAESAFELRTGLEQGREYSLFGKNMKYKKRLEDNQALSLVSYNILVNQKDWQYGLDESWNAVFLIDADKSRENQLRELLKNSPCELETASEIVDTLSNLMSEYLSVVLVVGMMLVLVIGTFFYSMIQNDFIERKTEMYLYQIYGASSSKAQGIIILEYLMIAVIASFSVVFVIMIFGEVFFYYMLQKHYPISIPVVILTTVAVTVFVLLCAVVAGLFQNRGKEFELIRDE